MAYEFCISLHFPMDWEARFLLLRGGDRCSVYIFLIYHEEEKSLRFVSGELAMYKVNCSSSCLHEKKCW